VIAEQTHQTRRAADSGAEAANAAYGSVTFARAQWELTKEKERARLDVKGGSLYVESPDEAYWSVRGTMRTRNIGASRAFIIKSSAQFVIRAKDGNYPSADEGSQVPFTDSFLDPNDSFIDLAFYCFPDTGDRVRHLAEDLSDSRRTIHIYGSIDYDTLGMRLRKEFGFIWTVIDPAFSLGGIVGDSIPLPTDANKIMFGYWTTDAERDKPEYPIDQEQTDSPKPN
jgi:hypothetical protein